MTGQPYAAGDTIYRQGDAVGHLFVVLSGEVVMYERDVQHSQQDNTAAAHAASPDGSASSSSSSSSGAFRGGSSASGARSPRQRAGSSSGLRMQQSPRVNRAGSPSTHKPGSPRRLGSSAGGRDASAAGSAAVRTSSPGTGEGAGPQKPHFFEVRRVKPREAFGEDDLRAGTRREQTAVSVGANRHTFSTVGPVRSGDKATEGSGSSSGGVGGASSSSSIGSSGGAATPSAAGTAAEPAGGSPALAPAPALLAAGAAAAAAGDPSSQSVVLVLSAEDYGAALEGRLTSLLEEKASDQWVSCRHVVQGLVQLCYRAMPRPSRGSWVAC
jgi:CRP-like cAMP-binding protein